ncbi:hypothetical protein Tco_1314968 [Tanacetum coccineum]
MDHGLNGHCLKGLCPWDRRPPTRYISRLWAAITIQEYTRNWKDKKTHPVDCRATSPTRQERDSLKSQGRGWPRGPTWRLGISAGNAKVFTRTATWGKLAKFFLSRCLSRFLNNLYRPVESASLLYSYISFSNGNFPIVKEGMPSILLEPSDHRSGDRVLSCGRALPHIRRAARRFLTLAGYDMKCVTPNAMKSQALVDLLAHFPCGEYEYAPPAELSAAVLEEANKFQKTCLQCKFYPCPAECALEHYIMKTGESPIFKENFTGRAIMAILSIPRDDGYQILPWPLHPAWHEPISDQTQAQAIDFLRQRILTSSFAITFPIRLRATSSMPSNSSKSASLTTCLSSTSSDGNPDQAGGLANPFLRAFTKDRFACH